MRFFIILLGVCFLQCTKAKGNWDGVYIGGTHTMIINEGTLTIKSNSDMHWGSESQVLTVCDITYIDKHFASIKSKQHPSEDIFKDMVVTYEDSDIVTKAIPDGTYALAKSAGYHQKNHERSR